MDRATAPDQRPPWFVVLSSLMLMMGGFQVGSAASVILDPASEADREPAYARTDAERALEYQYAAQQAEVFRQHPVAVRALAAARLGSGLLLLYAAAAALMRDRRGRGVALAAAMVAIPYHAAKVLIGIRLWREIAARLAPWVEPAIAAAGKVKTDEISAASATSLYWLQFHPVRGAVTGVLFSLVILWYFGGRKGKQLYGLYGLGR